MKRNWPRFNEPYRCHTHIHVIAIVKFSSRSIQNLFNIDKGTCIYFRILGRNFMKKYKTKLNYL